MFLSISPPGSENGPHVIRRACRRLVGGIFAAFAFLVISSPPAKAFTTADADNIFNAYNNAFYIGGPAAYYKASTLGGRAGFWALANEIEMVEDTYERSRNPGHRDMVTALCNGFLAYEGSPWAGNPYNDDVIWACIAFSRAYQITGNTLYRDVAKANFDMVWNRAWNGVLGGGLFWHTDNQRKNACVNGPAVIAACYLYQILNDGSYLTKAQQIYAWMRATLYEPGTGKVYDGIAINGVVDTVPLTYNSGTFVAAGNFLYNFTGQRSYYMDARTATLFTKNVLCGPTGLLPVSYAGADLEGFNGIAIRWITRFVRDQNLWGDFYPWLKTNADAAWNVRRGDNLSWQKWDTATPSGELQSFQCYGSVVALQVVPPTDPTAWFMLVNKATGKCVDLASGNTANGATVNQWSYLSSSPNQRWALVPTEDGLHFKFVAYSGGKVISVYQDQLVDGAKVHNWQYDSNASQQWDLVDAGNGWFKIRNVRSGKFLDVDAGNSADGTKIQQWANSGANQQLWRLQPWGDYFLRTEAGKYLRPENGATSNGTRVTINSLDGSAPFKWRIENVGEGLVKISNLAALSSAIAVDSASYSAGYQAQIWTYNAAHVDQKLRVVPEVNGHFKFYYAFNGLCWDIPNNLTTDGTRMQQWMSNGAKQQLFRLERAP